MIRNQPGCQEIFYKDFNFHRHRFLASALKAEVYARWPELNWWKYRCTPRTATLQQIFRRVVIVSIH